MIELLLTLGLLALAAAAYAVQSHYTHHNEVKDPTSFFGQQSWVRKYKQNLDGTLIKAPENNWYYKLFKLQYREKFLFSTSLFVWVTDYWHFCQFIWVNSLFLLYSHTWWGFAVLWSVWHLTFNIVYLVKNKRKDK